MRTPGIDKKIVVDKDGHPVEVIIPYAQFVAFAEAYGLDLDTETREQLVEADAGMAAGNLDAFADLDGVRGQLACTE
jgi:hypothetical protein